MPDRKLPHGKCRRVKNIHGMLPHRNHFGSDDRYVHCHEFVTALSKHPQLRADLLKTARECHAVGLPPRLGVRAHLMLKVRYHGIAQQWHGQHGHAVHKALRVALIEGGAWSSFEYAFIVSALSDSPRTPGVHVQRCEFWGEPVTLLGSQEEVVLDGNDECIHLTLKISPLHVTSQLHDVLDNVIQDANLGQYLHGPEGTRRRGPHRGYDTDVDLYAKLDAHITLGGSKASFIRAIAAKTILIEGWGENPPESNDGIERRLDKARSWLAPLTDDRWARLTLQDYLEELARYDPGPGAA
jgi:hypothetical protein